MHWLQKLALFQSLNQSYLLSLLKVAVWGVRIKTNLQAFYGPVTYFYVFLLNENDLFVVSLFTLVLNLVRVTKIYYVQEQKGWPIYRQSQLIIGSKVSSLNTLMKIFASLSLQNYYFQSFHILMTVNVHVQQHSIHYMKKVLTPHRRYYLNLLHGMQGWFEANIGGGVPRFYRMDTQFPSAISP